MIILQLSACRVNVCGYLLLLLFLITNSTIQLEILTVLIKNMNDVLLFLRWLQSLNTLLKEFQPLVLSFFTVMDAMALQFVVLS